MFTDTARPALRPLLHRGTSWLQAHQDRNEARMLTPAERREKKLTKLVGEQGPDTLVALYKVRLTRFALPRGPACPLCPGIRSMLAGPATHQFASLLMQTVCHILAEL